MRSFVRKLKTTMSQDSPGPDSTSGSEWNQEQRGDVSLPSYLSVYDDPSASGDTIGDASRNRSSTPGKSKQEDDISRRRAALVPTTELDPSWIDIETIQIWINQCTYGHEKCERPLYSGGGPDWLIDTIDLCLVQTRHLPADVRYFALSYVWGQAESAELTKVAADAFQKPGVFAIGNTDVVIPKTIRQSMQLVTLLGERYLWVDRLCIAQDDKTHLHHQIHIMASIYHQAHVTIVAAAGWDCDEGFKGIKGISPPRQLAPNYADDYGKYLDLSNTIWDSRGWTYQERAFSRRNLIFSGQVVIWECASLDADEGNISGSIADDDIRNRQTAFFSLHSDMPKSVGQFLELTTSYNTRNLTKPSDGYRAFAGFLSGLAQLANEPDFMWLGDLWGLPVARFHEALLWSPRQAMQRRDLSLPLWSWVGWQGSLFSMALNWRAVRQGDSENIWLHNSWFPVRTLNTIPICAWRFSSTRIDDGGMAHTDTADLCDITRETIGRLAFADPCLYTKATTCKYPVSAMNRLDPDSQLVSSGGANADALFVLHDWKAYTDSDLIELVAVSQSWASWDYQEPLPQSGVSLIDVIAIEWAGSFARRVGVGRVTEKHWNSRTGLVVKDIVLR